MARFGGVDDWGFRYLRSGFDLSTTATLVLQFICTNRRGRRPPTTTTTFIGLWSIALVLAFHPRHEIAVLVLQRLNYPETIARYSSVVACFSSYSDSALMLIRSLRIEFTVTHSNIPHLRQLPRRASPFPSNPTFANPSPICI